MSNNLFFSLLASKASPSRAAYTTFENSLATPEASSEYISMPYLSAKSMVTGAPPTASFTVSLTPASSRAFICSGILARVVVNSSHMSITKLTNVWLFNDIVKLYLIQNNLA